jgi:hypothetical protein
VCCRRRRRRGPQIVGPRERLRARALHLRSVIKAILGILQFADGR